jgi:hypothetical protein
MTDNFTRVKDLDDNKIGTVLDHLSVQFTAEFDGKVRFFFYNQKGLTYEPIMENDNGNSNQGRK